MNAKIALVLPLPVQAGAPIPDIDPVHAVAPQSLVKGCYHGAFGYLDRREIARGLGRSWSGEMNRLRKDANREAAQVCSKGWPAVKFTFIRAKKAADMAIATATARERIAAIP